MDGGQLNLDQLPSLTSGETVVLEIIVFDTNGKRYTSDDLVCKWSVAPLGDNDEGIDTDQCKTRYTPSQEHSNQAVIVEVEGQKQQFKPAPPILMEFNITNVEGPTIAEVIPEPTPPSTGTYTPSSTPTPTPTATPTPVPMPTAMVTAEALNLRAGPGIEYKIIRTLKGGETLTVLGRTPNGDWLHVRTSRQEEGWVNASYVDLGGNLDLVPTAAAIPKPPLLAAPTPLSPLTGGEANFVNEVKLEWKWIRPLAESEYFSVRVSRQDTGKVCCHDKTQDTVYEGSLVGCYSGKLFWEVAAVRSLSRDPERWLELSKSSEPQFFLFEK